MKRQASEEDKHFDKLQKKLEDLYTQVTPLYRESEHLKREWFRTLDRIKRYDAEILELFKEIAAFDQPKSKSKHETQSLEPF